jgi:hypothetical protein
MQRASTWYHNDPGRNYRRALLVLSIPYTLALPLLCQRYKNYEEQQGGDVYANIGARTVRPVGQQCE